MLLFFSKYKKYYAFSFSTKKKVKIKTFIIRNQKFCMQKYLYIGFIAEVIYKRLKSGKTNSIYKIKNDKLFSS